MEELTVRAFPFPFIPTYLSNISVYWAIYGELSVHVCVCNQW